MQAMSNHDHEETLITRALRLGARFATVHYLLFPLRGVEGVSIARKTKLAGILGIKRVSGQIPTNDKGLMSSQLRLHTTVFARYLSDLPADMPDGQKIIQAYESYARMVVTVDDDGNILDRQGSFIGRGGADRDHSALPKLSLDRAAHFAKTLLLSMNNEVSMGTCKSCKTPVLLNFEERSQTYRCAHCTQRLEAGRTKRKGVRH
jgi:hypothetical protein